MKTFSSAILTLVALFSFSSPLNTMIALGDDDTIKSEAKLRVAVSVAPLQAIVHAIAQEHVVIDLLIEAQASPHGGGLPPSRANLIQQADLLVWFGPQLETSLIKPLRNLGAGRPVVEALSIEDLQLLPRRTTHEPHHHHEEHHDHDNAHEEKQFDAHIWLDPSQVSIIASHLADVLGKLDPKRVGIFHSNLHRFQQQLEALTMQIRGQLNQRPFPQYVLFHDSLAYFERHFQLPEPLILTQNPDLPVRAQHARQLRHMIQEHEITCLLGEVSLRKTPLDSFAKDLKLPVYTIDPAGQVIDTNLAGDQWYQTLLLDIAQTITKCFEKH